MDLEIRQITRDEIEQIHQLEAESKFKYCFIIIRLIRF